MFLITLLVVFSFERFKNVHGQPATTFSANLFKKKLAITCGPVRLGPGWSESSQINCAISCTKRYQKTCHSFMYNKITHLCTPGSAVSTSQLPPSSNEGDLYVTDSCDSYPEFSQYSYNTSKTFAAIFHAPVNYTQAAVTCQCLDSHLFVAKTVEKYALFSNLSSGCTWMGLDDIEVEGKFVWSDNHQPIDQVTMQTLSFQPDNAAGRQNCARDCKAWLDDDYCHLKYRFICEKSNSPC